MFHNEGKNVQTCAGIILWDGITQPDTDERTGALVHSIKIAIPAQSVERGEIDQLATVSLQASDFKGQLPPGGEWPVREIDFTKLTAPEDQQRLQGYVAINAKTRNGVPPIFDANGQELGAMQFGRMLYPGAVVSLLVHAYSFNNKSKGVALGLDGIQILDATAPKLAVGAGMSSAAVGAVFGARPGGIPGNVPQPGVPTQPATDFVANAAMGGIPPRPAGSSRVMLPAANGHSYEAMIAAGWTDAALVQHGMMQG